MNKQTLVSVARIGMLVPLALLVLSVCGCNGVQPTQTTTYDPRTGVAQAQLEHIEVGCMFMYKRSNPPAIGSPSLQRPNCIVSRMKPIPLDSGLQVWIVPAPGFRWTNPNDGTCNTVVPIER